jgi:hypothetical protein
MNETPQLVLIRIGFNNQVIELGCDTDYHRLIRMVVNPILIKGGEYVASPRHTKGTAWLGPRDSLYIICRDDLRNCRGNYGQVLKLVKRSCEIVELLAQLPTSGYSKAFTDSHDIQPAIEKSFDFSFRDIVSS